MTDHYSDDSMLTEEEREILRMMRADNQITLRTPADQRSKLAREKQAFPIGIRPDGTVNLVPDEDDDRE